MTIFQSDLHTLRQASGPPNADDGHVERQLRDGRQFVLDAPTTVPAIWGAEDKVLWAAGESLILVGPQGVGKSTVAQQLVLGRIGALPPDFLGLPITADESRKVLYVAADRPRQIARSLRRMVDETHAEVLEQRLLVWAGPLPFDVVREPHRLAVFAESLGVGTVVIDSLKDIAWPLSADEVGAAVNRATATTIAAEIEVLLIHHNRKSTAENSKPRQLDDVFGSTWITSGAGSVVSLWGQAGDPIVELGHLKQPVDEVGPLDLVHDHTTGTTRLLERPDAWTVLTAATAAGVTASDAAAEIYMRKPSRAQIEKVRRRLDRYVAEGHATSTKGADRTDQVVYRPQTRDGRVKGREAPREGSRAHHDASRSPVNTDHADYTATEALAPLKGRG